MGSSGCNAGLSFNCEAPGGSIAFRGLGITEDKRPGSAHASEILLHEVLNLVERNHGRLVVEIGVVRARDDEELLVVPLQHLEGVFTETARMRLRFR